MPDPILLLVILALPFAGAVGALFFRVNARNAESWLALSCALLAFGLVLGFYPGVVDGGVVRWNLEWIPALGLSFSLRLDGYAWMFALLVTGIGALVVVYARYYMSADDPVPRFFSFLLFFMACMLGVVLAGNLIQLVLFWELTSLFSFLLIGYWHHNAAARESARMALTVTAVGGFALFAGVLLLGRITGSYELDVVLASGDLIRADALYRPALFLIVTGALAKSAQFPFHFWLPHAMVAPTPVSAYLHSAAMVKLGVFLLARLWPALAGTDAWMFTVGLSGLVTFVLGAFIAIFQNDLKGLLAYSTISHLGLITVLLGLNSQLALVAAVFHIMNHATFKASLFMAAGVIDHETGTRDMRRLSRLVHYMPLTATAAMVAAAAMAGVPLLNGFLSKEMFFSLALDVQTPLPFVGRALPWVAIAAGMFGVAYSLRFIVSTFLGPDPQDLPRQPHEPPRWMRFPIELLVLACIAVGVLPNLTVRPILDVAVGALLGADAPDYQLALWHGFNLPVMMSTLAFVGGILLYGLLHRWLANGIGRVPFLPPVDGRRVFARLVVGGRQAARHLEHRLASRRLQVQLRWIILLAVAAACVPLLRRDLVLRGSMPFAAGGDGWLLAFSWLVGGACALMAAVQAKFHRLAAVVFAGGAGLMVCISFAWLSAPDLALTQLLVEIVTTVLLLLGLRWLPKRVPFIPTRAGALAALPRRALDFTLALAVGGGLALLAYAGMTRPPPSGSISRFFMEQALPAGGGSNVVNVILVDFRGFDTLGEITVLALAGIALYSLLRRFRPSLESTRLPLQQQLQSPAMHADDMLVPGVLMRLMFPVMLMLALYLLLRGHNRPGGGFVAGLVLAVGFIVQYMAGGTRWLESRLRVRPLQWMALGLLLAVGTGIGAWFFAHPFLSSHALLLELPLLGEVHLPSAVFFDFGVFTLVLGATLLMLIALAHQSLRGERQSKQF